VLVADGWAYVLGIPGREEEFRCSCGTLTLNLRRSRYSPGRVMLLCRAAVRYLAPYASAPWNPGNIMSETVSYILLPETGGSVAEPVGPSIAEISGVALMRRGLSHGAGFAPPVDFLPGPLISGRGFHCCGNA
jgi:hypothetical protein